MQYDLRARSATSQIGEVLILDDTGAPETGLVHNSSGLTCFASTDGGTAASVSLVDMTLGTYASGGFKQIDATNDELKKRGYDAVGVLITVWVREPRSQ
jgi:hypothetical protein